LRQLPISRLEPFLGRLELISVESPSLDQERNDLALWLTWTAKLAAKRGDGQEVIYEAVFEQFKGDLISITDVSLRNNGSVEQK
jgi:hypothetical protein